MKRVYNKLDKTFEKLVARATAVLGNSITFVIALGVVIFWLTNKLFYTQDIHDRIGDVILGVTFLSLFIIQKSFNRFSASLHLKVNELVMSHEPANNTVIHAEDRTEKELRELSKKYLELIEEIKEQKKALV